MIAKLYKRNPSFAWSSNLLLFHSLPEAAVPPRSASTERFHCAAMYEERGRICTMREMVIAWLWERW